MLRYKIDNTSLFYLHFTSALIDVSQISADRENGMKY